MTGSVNPTKILLKEIPKEQEKVTKSGIIMPEAVIKSPTSMAVAVVVGEGTAFQPMKVAVGNRVLFMPHAVTKVVVPDEGELLLLDSKDVLYYF
jgi:co-chaperonin GroES (HSP10)